MMIFHACGDGQSPDNPLARVKKKKKIQCHAMEVLVRCVASLRQRMISLELQAASNQEQILPHYQGRRRLFTLDKYPVQNRLKQLLYKTRYSIGTQWKFLSMKNVIVYKKPTTPTQ
jgi:hypothetical protein